MRREEDEEKVGVEESAEDRGEEEEEVGRKREGRK
jgi:hypothetical protein